MINKIKVFFSNWTLFEILLATFSPIVILTVGLIFKTDAPTIITAIVGIMCAFLTAKGLVIGQFFGIAIVVLYSLISYKKYKKILFKNSKQFCLEIKKNSCYFAAIFLIFIIRVFT